MILLHSLGFLLLDIQIMESRVALALLVPVSDPDLYFAL